jgi:hypothetical protein
MDIQKRKQDAIDVLEHACFLVHKVTEEKIESLVDPIGRTLRNVEAIHLTVIPWYGYDMSEIEEMNMKLSEIGYKIADHENITQSNEWRKSEYKLHVVPA